MLPLLGQPHRHPSHPDYVPSVFPSVYKKHVNTKLCQERTERLMERQLKKQNEPDQEHQKERSEAEKKEFEKKGKEEIEQLQSRWEHELK